MAVLRTEDAIAINLTLQNKKKQTNKTFKNQTEYPMKPYFAVSALLLIGKGCHNVNSPLSLIILAHKHMFVRKSSSPLYLILNVH